MIKICPWCGFDMTFIEEPHTELTPVAYEHGYWECFKCGCCLDDTNNIEDKDYDYEEY